MQACAVGSTSPDGGHLRRSWGPRPWRHRHPTMPSAFWSPTRLLHHVSLGSALQSALHLIRSPLPSVQPTEGGGRQSPRLPAEVPALVASLPPAGALALPLAVGSDTRKHLWPGAGHGKSLPCRSRAESPRRPRRKTETGALRTGRAANRSVGPPRISSIALVERRFQEFGHMCEICRIEAIRVAEHEAPDTARRAARVASRTVSANHNDRG
jgi:hypothetical protein